MSIFDQSEDTISLEEFQISHEMIAPQLDDPVKAQLEQEVDYIIEFLNKRKIKANQHEKAMKDIEYKGHIENFSGNTIILAFSKSTLNPLVFITSFIALKVLQACS